MHVIGEVGERDLCFGAFDADGADEQPHLVFLPGEDVLDAGADFRFGGAQVGDLDLFNANNLAEHLYTGKTRALNGTHVGLGDQLFSNIAYLRPIATITHDTLDWYGFDEFGGSVHDIIGTRCGGDGL